MEPDIPKGIEQKRDRAVIEQELSAVWGKMDALENRMEPVLQSVIPEDQPAIESFFQRREEARESGQEFAEPYPNETYAQLGEAMDEGRALEAERRALEVELVPFVNEDIRTLTAKALVSIDYQQVIEGYLDSDIGVPHFSEFIRVHQLLAGGYNAVVNGILLNQDYFDLIQFKKFIETEYDRYKKLGYINSELEQNTALEPLFNPEHQEELVRDIPRIRESLEANSALLQVYRGENFLMNDLDDFLLNLYKGIDPNSLIVSTGLRHGSLKFPYAGLTAGFLAASAQGVNAYLEEIAMYGIWPQTEGQRREYLKIAKELSQSSILDNIRIEGLETRNGRKLIYTEAEIKEFLQDLIPAYFLEGIDEIVFTQKPQAVKDQDELSQRDIAAQKHYIKDDNGRIIGGQIVIYQDPTIEEGANEDEQLSQQWLLKDIIFHEVAHHAHSKMTIDELTAWEQTIEQDTTAVSSYVQTSRLRHPNLGKREDLCETFSAFVLDIGMLEILSAARFKYMANIFYSYATEEQWQRISQRYTLYKAFYQKKIDDAGQSLEQFREAYLDELLNSVDKTKTEGEKKTQD